ncbi:MAG TPA: aminotransferase class I/II-fold pyridoxal phosphate-dependent enzyme [Actinomycetes bacterium]
MSANGIRLASPAGMARSATAPVAAQRRVPLVEALEQYRRTGTVPFSCAGHKLGNGADRELVATLGAELFAADVWLDTASYDRTLREAEALAAAAWGADRTFFLGNGSSSGNHAFLLATLSPGDEVIVARDLHKSMLAALILTGARPVYVAPRLHPELGIAVGVHPDDVAAALDAHPAAKLLALVSPSYFGVAADVARITRLAHDRDVTVYVDEAWGPHFSFHPELPLAAMAAGADGAVTSTHKMLSSLSQSSILNVRAGRVAPDRVASAVKLTQTTSPLVPLLASVDACRRQMVLEGEALLDRTLDLAAAARRRLAMLPGLEVLDAAALDLPPFQLDPTKLVVDVAGLGITGLEAERALRDHFALAPEGSDLSSVILFVTIGDSTSSVEQLVGAFAALCAERGGIQRGPAAQAPPRSSGAAIAPGVQAMTPRDAFFAPARTVPLAAAAGEVAAELVTPYPPGIPVLAPGEVITADKLAYLADGGAHGMYVCGPADPSLATIRVVAADRSESTWTS